MHEWVWSWHKTWDAELVHRPCSSIHKTEKNWLNAVWQKSLANAWQSLKTKPMSLWNILTCCNWLFLDMRCTSDAHAGYGTSSPDMEHEEINQCPYNAVSILVQAWYTSFKLTNLCTTWPPVCVLVAFWKACTSNGNTVSMLILESYDGQRSGSQRPTYLTGLIVVLDVCYGHHSYIFHSLQRICNC